MMAMTTSNSINVNAKSFLSVFNLCFIRGKNYFRFFRSVSAI